ENPVYYIQYAHARICSLLAEAQSQDVEVIGACTWTSPHEKTLLRKLADFPDEVERAALERGPHHIARYALELAQAFHAFYTHCRVLGEIRDIESSRLRLAEATRVVLHRALEPMGINAPERM